MTRIHIARSPSNWCWMRTCSPRRRSYINHSIAINSPHDDGARCPVTTLRYDTRRMNGRRSEQPTMLGLPHQPRGQHAAEQPRGSAASRLATMVGLPVSSGSSAFSGQATLRPCVVDSSCRVRSHCSQIRSGRRPRSAPLLPDMCRYLATLQNPAGHMASGIDGANVSEILMRLPEVIAACGMSRSLIYKMAKEGRFPRPIRVAARLSVWDSKAVQTWIDFRCEEGRVG